MTKREMIERGRRAVVAAYPEAERGYTPTDDWSAHICDVIVDLCHLAESKGIDAEAVVNSALDTHYQAERGCPLDEEPTA